MTVLYLIRARCPVCEEVRGFIEERDSPVPLMEDVELSAEFCPNCGFGVLLEGPGWDLHEEAVVERVDPSSTGIAQSEEADRDV